MNAPLTNAHGMPSLDIPLEELFARMFPKPTAEQIAATKKRAMEPEEDEEDIDACFADDSYDPLLDEPPLPDLYDGN